MRSVQQWIPMKELIVGILELAKHGVRTADVALIRLYQTWTGVSHKVSLYNDAKNKTSADIRWHSYFLNSSCVDIRLNHALDRILLEFPFPQRNFVVHLSWDRCLSQSEPELKAHSGTEAHMPLRPSYLCLSTHVGLAAANDQNTSNLWYKHETWPSYYHP